MDQPPDAFAPIAGVTLDDFVAVSRLLASVQFDGARAIEVATGRGIAEDRWLQAEQGWARRLRAEPAVAEEFARRYHQEWRAR